MKNILLLATGGTIASKPEEGLLTPLISPEELLEYVPELHETCSVAAMQPFNKDSTNMSYTDWFRLSGIIKDNYAAYDGFVITHGTDTMAYAAAALSYFVQNNKKPIVITGSQKSIYLRDTDARGNLYNAFKYACDDRAAGTHIVFDGKVIVGTRARKTRTKSFNAFSAVDYPETAVFFGDRLRFFIESKMSGEPVFAKNIDTGVAVIKLIPGMKADIINFLAKEYSAIVIESFGVGGLPYYKDESFFSAVKRAKEAGVKIIITTQVPHEGSDMGVYKVGRAKDELGLIEARNMTVEAIVAKIVWALGLTKDGEEFKRIFLTPVGVDIF